MLLIVMLRGFEPPTGGLEIHSSNPDELQHHKLYCTVYKTASLLSIVLEDLISDSTVVQAVGFEPTE